MKTIVVIGGGPAGCMAALTAAKTARVLLLEQNEKLGKKLYITGKGRCNLTNAAAINDFFDQIPRNPKFLYSAFSVFDNEDLCAFFEAQGVPLKTERGNRVFPESDKSSDIIRALERSLKEAGVSVHLNERVTGLRTEDGRIVSVQTDKKRYACDACVIATGGVSYPTTGADGSGFSMVKSLGHTVTELLPSLVAVKTREDVAGLAGLTLKNVSLTVPYGKKKTFSEFGELLFTHTGISGPIVLTLSSVCAKELHTGTDLFASLDLKPALSEQQLSDRILREIEATPNQSVKNLLPRLFPRSLTPYALSAAKIQASLPLHDLSREQRLTLVSVIKGLPLTLCGTEGFKEAIITCGGMSVKEIDPKTMASKMIPNLYFAGEMLDCDAFTGGFNLQIAWSTGFLAGKHAATQTEEAS